MRIIPEIEVVVIGGSAGSLSILMNILRSLEVYFTLPIIIVIHRQRNVLSELTKILALSSRFKKIIEPDDKELVYDSCIYIAPQNYHLLIEDDRSFSLDYSEAVQYSRPSIDVTFESVSKIYKNKCAAILLSGANNDGTEGLRNVVDFGGTAIVQNPQTADYPAMPLAALQAVKEVIIMEPQEISDYLNNLCIRK